MSHQINTRTIAKHYLIAALWANAPEGTQPRITAQAQAVADAIAETFARDIACFWPEVLEAGTRGYGSHPDAGSVEAALGHDLWLTSQGHGTGFWDRPELAAGGILGERLSEVAQGDVYRQVDPEFYRGWVYLRGWRVAK